MIPDTVNDKTREELISELGALRAKQSVLQMDRPAAAADAHAGPSYVRNLETERSGRVEADRLGRIKDEFLANLSHEIESSSDPDLSGVNVLVVDDDIDALQLVKHVLENRGAHVTNCSSAEECLGVFPGSKPQVLIVDIGMPVMDGYSLIRQIRTLPVDKGGKIPAHCIDGVCPVGRPAASDAGGVRYARGQAG